MPTYITEASSQTISLSIGRALVVSTTGRAYVDLLSGAPGAPHESRIVIAGVPRSVGPFDVAAVVRIRADEGTAAYDDAQSATLSPAQVTSVQAVASGYRTRQVGTRCMVASGTSTANKSYFLRLAHFINEAVPGIQVGWDNAYVTTGNVETGPGAASTIQAAVEINGVNYPLTFGGQAVGTVANNARIISDFLPVSIAKNSQIFIRTRYNNAVGIMTAGNWKALAGEGIVTSATINDPATDLTAGVGNAGLTALSGATVAFPPSLILAPTQKNAVAIIGDSISRGFSDSANVGFRGDSGFMAKSVGPVMGYTIFGVSSTQAQHFTLANRLLAIAAINAYFDTAWINYGTNDIVAGSRTAVQTRDSILAITTLIPGLRCFVNTVLPRTSGTWATLAGQAVLATEQVRLDLNNALRAYSATTTGALAGVIDTAYELETRNDTVNLTNVAPCMNGGIWMVVFTAAGVGTALTPDGIHPNSTADGFLAGRVSSHVGRFL